MKLSRVERLILANQLEILSRLSDDEHEKKHYDYVRRGLQDGYEFMYEDAFNVVDKNELSESQCKWVLDVLDMHRILKYSYRDLQDKSGIDPDDIEFGGFDGNNEAELLGFTKHFINEPSGGRYTELSKGSDDFNSHAPMVGRYQKMLAEWRKSKDTNHLTKADIQRIVA